MTTAVFPKGTITLVHRQGRGGSTHFDPRTCLLELSQAGTYKLVRGTGAYAGISGHGTYSLSIIQIAARVKGACSSTARPVASQELIRLSGPVHLRRR